MVNADAPRCQNSQPSPWFVRGPPTLSLSVSVRRSEDWILISMILPSSLFICREEMAKNISPPLSYRRLSFVKFPRKCLMIRSKTSRVIVFVRERERKKERERERERGRERERRSLKMSRFEDNAKRRWFYRDYSLTQFLIYIYIYIWI